ncbi:outer membrane protein assembly factor [Fusobacterium phage Fnu1]|uniref:Outer membrane protein assembly factor n=1 Tax=Fusobacterium phage Fnu1 TaxID=2530024 RepID=A0A481W6L9_9CAUD|nr:outer membrane protein assembly factor [Fusobacterium phage Fnu1]QBJ04163.1 outer membrane protein assembly factor [Fusobacterium phage Fnu1]
MIKKTRLVVSDRISNEDMSILAERHQQTVNSYLFVYPNSYIINTNVIGESIITMLEYEVKPYEAVWYNKKIVKTSENNISRYPYLEYIHSDSLTAYIKDMKEIVDITTRLVVEGQTRSLYTTIYYK